MNGGGGCEGGGGLPGNGREPDGGAPWGARIAEGGARPFPGGGAPPAKGGAAAREISMLAKGAASDPGTVVGFCAANGGGGLDGDEDAMDRRAGRRSGSDEDGEETREKDGFMSRRTRERLGHPAGTVGSCCNAGVLLLLLGLGRSPRPDGSVRVVRAR